jgi:YbbR domain-containing protein
MATFLRRYVFHNLSLKLVSLAMAAGLWLAVARNPIAEVELPVPIEFHHFPEKLEIASESIPQAQVRVRGPERVVRPLRPSDVHVEIDLTGAKPGVRTFDLTARQVREPRDLEVVQIVPGQLRLTFDERLDRQVEVHPRVIGSFAPGLRVAQVIADPPVIKISGPRQRVEKAEAATTDPIDASGTMQRASFTTHAYVSDPLVQVVNPAPIRVTVIMEKTAGAPGGLQ